MLKQFHCHYWDWLVRRGGERERELGRREGKQRVLLRTDGHKFSLVLDPPDPVNISSIESVVNCTGVYLYWTPPVTPKKCDILSYDIIVQWNDTVVTTKEPYDIIWNDTVVTTKEPFHYWVAAELPSNEVLTVGIKAFNGNGPSQETSIDIITAVGK